MFSKLKNHAFSAGFHSGTSNSGSSGSNPGSLHNLPGATSAVAANTNVPIAASNLSNVAALQQQPQQQQQTQSQPLAMQPASVMSNLSASLGPNVHLPQYLSTSSGQMSYPPLIQPASGISLNVGPTMMSSTMQNQPRNSSPAPSHAIANQSYQNVGPMMPMPPPAQLTQPQPMANSSSLPNAITQHFEIGSLIGSAGPELAWRIYSAIRKCDRMPGEYVFLYLMPAQNVLVLLVNNLIRSCDEYRMCLINAFRKIHNLKIYFLMAYEFFAHVPNDATVFLFSIVTDCFVA